MKVIPINVPISGDNTESKEFTKYWEPGIQLNGY